MFAIIGGSMDLYGISGGSSQIYDQQTFGAAVVSKTLDYMNKTSSTEFAPVNRESFGAAVVSTTLDNMNVNSNDCLANSYSFQNDVVLGHLSGKLLDQLV